MEAFRHGFDLLRLDKRSKGIFPQQVKLVDCLAQGRRFAVLQLPRQSSKTSSIEAYLLGLCATVPGLRVMFLTASSGKRGQTHFWEEIAAPLEAQYPDASERPFVLRKGNGQSSILWPNGSRFSVALTKEDFRGASVDIAWIDEAGTLEGDKKTELLSSILPTQDTRKGVVLEQPLLILSGTAGKNRTNALWDYLEKGRAGDPAVAILEYSAGVDLVAEDLEDWDEDVVPLLLKSHPGIGTLTDLEMIRSSYSTFTREDFAAEYLGIHGTTGSVTGKISPSKWAESEVNSDVPQPAGHWAVAVSVHRNQSCASVAAAWRDTDGVAHVALLDHREGMTWLAPEVAAIASANRYVPIAYDERNQFRTEVNAVLGRVPRASLLKLGLREVPVAAALFTKEVHTGNLKHYGQKALTSAVLVARERPIGVNEWGFGRPEKDSDITGIEAASLALYTLDNTEPRKARNVYFGN